jgi:hypothetical protein
MIIFVHAPILYYYYYYYIRSCTNIIIIIIHQNVVPQQLHKTLLKKDRFQHINNTCLLQSHCESPRIAGIYIYADFKV